MIPALSQVGNRPLSQMRTNRTSLYGTARLVAAHEAG
jgi:hypothetical protein